MTTMWQNIIAIAFMGIAAYSGFSFVSDGGTTLQNWGLTLAGLLGGGVILFNNLSVWDKVKALLTRKPVDNTKIQVAIEEGDEIVRDLQSIRRLKKRFGLLESAVDRQECLKALETLWNFVDNLPEEK